MLRFEDINMSNWNIFHQPVLQTESIFPEEIRTSAKDFEVIFYAQNISKCALFGSEYVGNAIGYPITTKEEFEEYGICPENVNKKIIYLFSFAVDPKHQGKGYGYKLLLEFIKSAKEQGYSLLIGHFRPNASYSLIKKLGGKEIKVCKNWENTKEDYIMCEIDLKNFILPEIKVIIPN